MMIDKSAEMIKECNSIVFFGGAGVSTEHFSYGLLSDA